MAVDPTLVGPHLDTHRAGIAAIGLGWPHGPGRGSQEEILLLAFFASRSPATQRTLRLCDGAVNSSWGVGRHIASDRVSGAMFGVLC